MTPKQVRKYFNGPTKFAAVTGYTRRTLYNWELQGYVPKTAQIRLAHCSLSELKIGKPFNKGDL
jgi:hypothetical protein